VSATFKVPASAGHSLLNTAQVCGQSQGKTVCDSDTHVVKIPGQPGIDIAKSVSQASANPGETLTFTYDVTNVGDTKLTNVTVDDDVLGKLLDGHSLEPGESVTFTTDFEVANDSPTRNVATACGEDPDGTKICDTAAVTFELTLPSGPQQAGGPQGGPAGTLPRTGFSLLLWLAGGLNLIATGLAMMFRRRWPTA
jgi:hypothetical protein